MTADLPTFEVPQFYETAIAMRDLGDDLDREFRFLCLPKTAVRDCNQALLNDPEELLSMLELSGPLPLRVAQLPDAIFGLLRAHDLDASPSFALELLSSPSQLGNERESDPDASLFAEYLAFAEVVPFEQSLPRGHSLTTLAMKSYRAVDRAASIVTLASPAALAPLLGPHAPVVFLAIGAGVGAVVVVDSVGVVVGVVTSHKSAEVVGRVRRGFRVIIHRALNRPRQAEPIEVGAQRIGSAVTVEQPAETAEQERVRIQHERALEHQRILKRRARKITIPSEIHSLGETET